MRERRQRWALRTAAGLCFWRRLRVLRYSHISEFPLHPPSRARGPQDGTVSLACRGKHTRHAEEREETTRHTQRARSTGVQERQMQGTAKERK